MQNESGSTISFATMADTPDLDSIIAGRHEEQAVIADSQPQLFLVTLKRPDVAGTRSHEAVQC
jgi:hypothetical protein